MNEISTENKPWYKKWWAICLIVIFVLLLIILSALAIYTLNIVKNVSSGEINLSKPDLSADQLKKINGDNNYWLGTTSPQVTIVEFGDFACPHCREAFSTIREISVKYKKEIKIIFRDYPVIADYSQDLAMAGRCAGEQNLFWPMYDKLYLNQGVNQTSQYVYLAKQIGADTVKFKNCLDQQKYLANIQKDFSDGEDLGISGTPTWFINGNKVEGNIPRDTFINLIEQLLK